MKRLIIFILPVLILSGFLLAACGQSGRLYLPEQMPKKVHAVRSS